MKWLQKQHFLFMEQNGLTTKREADQKYLLQVYADRSDVVFEGTHAGGASADGTYAGGASMGGAHANAASMGGAHADSALYRERRTVMDGMIQEYLAKLHPMERRKYGIFSEDTLPSLRHIYFSQACEYIFRPAESGSQRIRPMTSISYGSELLNNIKLLGEIPRKTMIRHILIMCIPFINERVISTYLSDFGYCPLDEEHTLSALRGYLLVDVLSLEQTAEPKSLLRVHPLIAEAVKGIMPPTYINCSRLLRGLETYLYGDNLGIGT